MTEEKIKFKFGDKVMWGGCPDRAVFVANTKLKKSGSNCIILLEREWNKYFPYSIRRTNTEKLRRGWKRWVKKKK